MNSPKCLLVDITLLAASAAAALSEYGPQMPSDAGGCVVEAIQPGPQCLIVVMQGDNLPTAPEVHSAIAQLLQESLASLPRKEPGWEVLFIPPDELHH